MASDAARHRLASPRLTNFDSVALSCTRVRRAASPRLAYVCMPLKTLSSAELPNVYQSHLVAISYPHQKPNFGPQAYYASVLPHNQKC